MWFYCYIELCNQNLTAEQCTYKLYRTYIYITFYLFAKKKKKKKKLFAKFI